MKTHRKLVFGKKAKYTYFGLRGCSHGCYLGGYNYYIYGFKGLLNYIVDEQWGDMITDKCRYNKI